MATVHIQATEGELTSAGLSPMLARFVLHHPRNGLFHWWCGEDNRRWPDDIPWPYHNPESVSDVYPIWNRDAEQLVMWLRDGKQEFVWLYHDGDDHTFVAATEQGMLADLFITLIENHHELPSSSSEFEHAAAVVGFRFLDLVRSFVDSQVDRTQYEQAKRVLLDHCDADQPAGEYSGNSRAH